MSIFDNILKNFSNKKGNSVIGVDIGSTSIKIVQLSIDRGVAVLDTFGEISLSTYGDKEIGTVVDLDKETLAEALSDLLTESQAKSENLLFSIPLKSSLMFNLKLPKSIEESKMDNVVKLEAKKYIPVPIDEVQMNWSIIPQLKSKVEEKEEKENEVLVIAIHKDTINKYVDIAALISKKIQTIEIEIFSTIRSVVKHERNTVIIIDVGAALTKVYIIENGIIRKSNIINIGSQEVLNSFRVRVENNGEIKKKDSDINSEITKLFREKMNDSKEIPIDLLRIMTEVKKTIILYQNETGRDIAEGVFTGGASLFSDFYKKIEEELSLEIIESDPFSKVRNPAYLDEPLKDAGPEFSVAVGIALRGLRELGN